MSDTRYLLAVRERDGLSLFRSRSLPTIAHVYYDVVMGGGSVAFVRAVGEEDERDLTPLEQAALRAAWDQRDGGRR